MSTRPKRKCTMMAQNASNSAPTSKRARQDKTNESPDIGSKLSTIEDLPTEILTKIIGLLPIVQWPVLERVSPKIRDVVYTAWRSLKKIDIPRDLLPRQQAKSDGDEAFRNKRIAILEKLVKRAPTLIDIAVGCSKIEATQGLRFVMAQLVEFEKLQRIDFGENCLSIPCLGRFLRESASRDQLKEIVSIKRSINQCIKKDHLYVAFDNSTTNYAPLRLETLNFVRLTDTLQPMPWSFLAMVDVSRLATFRVLNMNVPQRLLADFLDRTPQLRQLSFEFGCRYTQDDTLHESGNAIETVLEANKRILSAIARMESLESLIMGSSIFSSSTCSCGNFDQPMIELLTLLGQRRQSFKELGLVGQLPKLASMTWIAVAITQVESLRLDIDFLTTPTLDTILLPQSNLRKLHVSAHHHSADADLFDVTKYVMQNAPTLESLILDLPSTTVTGDDLKALGNLKELRELKLNLMDWIRFDGLDDGVLKSWGDGFGANLTKLEIKNRGSSITEDAFATLIEMSPNLNTCVIGDESVTDVTLKKMAALSPKIEVFGCDCTNVTSIGLQHIIDGFRHLKKLDLKKIDWRLKRNLNLDFGNERVVNVYESYML